MCWFRRRGGYVFERLQIQGEQRGEITSWVLISLMSSALVVAVWGVAKEKLVQIVTAALSSVCGGIGC